MLSDDKMQELLNQARLTSEHNPAVTVIVYVPKAGKKPSVVSHSMTFDEMKRQGYYTKRPPIAAFREGKQLTV